MMLRSFPERPEDRRKRRRRQRQKIFHKLFRFPVKFPQWLRAGTGIAASSAVKVEQDETHTE